MWVYPKRFPTLLLLIATTARRANATLGCGSFARLLETTSKCWASDIERVFGGNQLQCGSGYIYSISINDCDATANAINAHSDYNADPKVSCTRPAGARWDLAFANKDACEVGSAKLEAMLLQPPSTTTSTTKTTVDTTKTTKGFITPSRTMPSTTDKTTKGFIKTTTVDTTKKTTLIYAGKHPNTHVDADSGCMNNFASQSVYTDEVEYCALLCSSDATCNYFWVYNQEFLSPGRCCMKKSYDASAGTYVFEGFDGGGFYAMRLSTGTTLTTTETPTTTTTTTTMTTTSETNIATTTTVTTITTVSGLECVGGFLKQTTKCWVPDINRVFGGTLTKCDSDGYHYAGWGNDCRATVAKINAHPSYAGGPTISCDFYIPTGRKDFRLYFNANCECGRKAIEAIIMNTEMPSCMLACDEGWDGADCRNNIDDCASADGCGNGSCTCDWQCYLNQYPDLKEAYGSDVARAEQHWRNYGESEGRMCHCSRAGELCSNHGTCKDEVNGFTCDCAAGWSGATCATTTKACNLFPKNTIIGSACESTPTICEAFVMLNNKPCKSFCENAGMVCLGQWNEKAGCNRGEWLGCESAGSSRDICRCELQPSTSTSTSTTTTVTTTTTTSETTTTTTMSTTSTTTTTLNATQLAAQNITAPTLKQQNMTAAELISKGFPLKTLVAAGYTKGDLLEAGLDEETVAAAMGSVDDDGPSGSGAAGVPIAVAASLLAVLCIALAVWWKLKKPSGAERNPITLAIYQAEAEAEAGTATINNTNTNTVLTVQNPAFSLYESSVAPPDAGLYGSLASSSGHSQHFYERVVAADSKEQASSSNSNLLDRLDQIPTVDLQTAVEEAAVHCNSRSHFDFAHIVLEALAFGENLRETDSQQRNDHAQRHRSASLYERPLDAGVELLPAGFTAADAASIHVYTQPSPLYGGLNGALGGWGEGGAAALPHYLSYGKLLMAACRKLPTYSGRLFRGVRMPPSVTLGGKGVGDILELNAFTSTTTTSDVLRDATFLGIGEEGALQNNEERTVFQYAALTAVPIRRFSALGDAAEAVHDETFTNEDEVLLLPGTRLKIDKITKWHFGVVEVQAHELPPVATSDRGGGQGAPSSDAADMYTDAASDPLGIYSSAAPLYENINAYLAPDDGSGLYMSMLPPYVYNEEHGEHGMVVSLDPAPNMLPLAHQGAAAGGASSPVYALASSGPLTAASSVYNAASAAGNDADVLVATTTAAGGGAVYSIPLDTGNDFATYDRARADTMRMSSTEPSIGGNDADVLVATTTAAGGGAVYSIPLDTGNDFATYDRARADTMRMSNAAPSTAVYATYAGVRESAA